MWLFTKYGFFSVVCAHNDDDNMMIRARCKRHLTALMKRFQQASQPIVETLDTDYQFRIFVTSGLLSEIAHDLAAEIDYSNFKAAVGRNDTEYVNALHNIWFLVSQLQPKPPYSAFKEEDAHEDEEED